MVRGTQFVISSLEDFWLLRGLLGADQLPARSGWKSLPIHPKQHQLYITYIQYIHTLYILWTSNGVYALHVLLSSHRDSKTSQLSLSGWTCGFCCEEMGGCQNRSLAWAHSLVFLDFTNFAKGISSSSGRLSHHWMLPLWMTGGLTDKAPLHASALVSMSPLSSRWILRQTNTEK